MVVVREGPFADAVRVSILYSRCIIAFGFLRRIWKELFQFSI